MGGADGETECALTRTSSKERLASCCDRAEMGYRSREESAGIHEERMERAEGEKRLDLSLQNGGLPMIKALLRRRHHRTRMRSCALIAMASPLLRATTLAICQVEPTRRSRRNED